MLYDTLGVTFHISMKQLSTLYGVGFQVYMWGQCHGQAIVTPTETPFKSVHEICAFFATPSVTFKPMVTEINSGPSLLDSLKLAFDDPNTSDVKFVSDKKEIHVHKSILKIRFLTVPSLVVS